MTAAARAAVVPPPTTTTITSNFANLAAVQKAMHAKLRESTLTPADATKLRLQPCTAQQCAKLNLVVARAGFRIPYFDLSGRPTSFYRYRYLEYDNARGFSKLVHSANGNGNGTGPHKHDLRYTQPLGALPELYLSPQVPWTKVAADSTYPLVFTEGELKAACGCRHNLAVVGLGGVWNFKSANANLHLLPVFKEFKWPGREVYICYDSDGQSNAQVRQAEQALAHELANLGAVVYVCHLPALPGAAKTGLDDYIASCGVDQFKQDVMGRADKYTATEELYRLNAEVVYVQDPGLVLRLDTKQRLSARAFVEHAYSDRIWYQTVESPKGSHIVERSAAREWLKWPSRARVTGITYQPGQPELLPTGKLNTWPGWGLQPVAGDIAPWRALLDFVFHGWPDATARRRWFEQWLAYPLQHPGEKLNQSVVMYSIAQGTGKNVIGYTMGDIYGSNYIEISDKHLRGNFNGWAEHKQFVMGDEIASSSERKRDTADRMKSMITQREMIINQKYVPEYKLPDCINYYFTSNHPDALFLEDTDRRFFIHEIKGQPLPAQFYTDYCNWALRANGGHGAAHVFYYLRHLDLTGFDPKGHAPENLSKREMQREASGPTEVFVNDLRYSRAATLQLGGMPLPFTLYTPADLQQIAGSRDDIKPIMLGRALKRLGFQQVCKGTPVHGVGRPWGSRAADRVWAIVDRDKAALYENLSAPAVAAMYLLERAQPLPDNLRRTTLPPWFVPPPPDKVPKWQ